MAHQTDALERKPELLTMVVRNRFVNRDRDGSGVTQVTKTSTPDLWGNGNFTGATDTFADVTTGFAFTIDATKLSSASVRGSALPATTCSYDADFNPIGCVETTIDVDATWAGQGPIGRDTFAEHFKSDGFSFTDHFHGTSRDATASGTLGGLTLTSSDIEFADMGKPISARRISASAADEPGWRLARGPCPPPSRHGLSASSAVRNVCGHPYSLQITRRGKHAAPCREVRRRG